MKTALTAAVFSLATWSVMSPSVSAASPKTPPRETIHPAFREAIGNAPGKVITALVVDYPPGGKSIPHRHGAAFVVGYVLSGEIRSQVDHGKARVYRAGEHWTEQPGVHHTMSENASATKPAKLLAIFVSEAKQKDLVKWDKK